MKKLSILLLFISSFGFAQQNGNISKPAIDACPSFKKKPNANSKAEYFYFLRTNKAKDQQKSTYYPNTTPKAYPSKATVRYTAEEDPFLIPKRLKQNKVATPPKDYAATSSYYGATGSTTDKSTDVVDEPKIEKVEPLQKIEPVIATDKKTEADKLKSTPEKEITDTVDQSINKTSKKEKRHKIRSGKLFGKKVKSCKSKDPAKCPSF